MPDKTKWVEPPFKFVAIMERLSGRTRPLTATADPEVVEQVIRIFEQRLRRPAGAARPTDGKRQ